MIEFIWDPRKEWVNIIKHGISFALAAKAFQDPNRKIFRDDIHSEREDRWFCIGKVSGRILTVRFLYREDKIRIIGAGHWRKGRKHYEED